MNRIKRNISVFFGCLLFAGVFILTGCGKPEIPKKEMAQACLQQSISDVLDSRAFKNYTAVRFQTADDEKYALILPGKGKVQRLSNLEDTDDKDDMLYCVFRTFDVGRILDYKLEDYSFSMIKRNPSREYPYTAVLTLKLVGVDPVGQDDFFYRQNGIYLILKRAGLNKGNVFIKFSSVIHEKYDHLRLFLMLQKEEKPTRFEKQIELRYAAESKKWEFKSEEYGWLSPDGLKQEKTCQVIRYNKDETYEMLCERLHSELQAEYSVKLRWGDIYVTEKDKESKVQAIVRNSDLFYSSGTDSLHFVSPEQRAADQKLDQIIYRQKNGYMDEIPMFKQLRMLNEHAAASESLKKSFWQTLQPGLMKAMDDFLSTKELSEIQKLVGLQQFMVHLDSCSNLKNDPYFQKIYSKCRTEIQKRQESKGE